MTTGEMTKITIPLVRPTEFISCIKAIRALTAYGLKEAKDLIETPGDHWIRIVTGYDADKNAAILRQNGIPVAYFMSDLLQELRNIGAKALQQGEDEFASEIMQLVLAHKLRLGI